MDYPTDNDIRELEKKLRELKKYDILTVVQLLHKYGYRIGVFQKMKIKDDGKWVSESKGNDCKGKFTKKETENIKKYDILIKKPIYFQNRINKITHNLFIHNTVSCPFSVHDIRRHCINSELHKKNLTFEEGINISRGFHKNINTTLDHYYKK